MARIRTIKPEFPHSESMGRVSRDARLCFIMLWTLADDSGRLRGNSRMLASLLFPYDDDAPKSILKWLAELQKEDCIIKYQAHGDSYIEICNWLIHQKIDKPSPSKIPAIDDDSRTFARIREDSLLDQGSSIKDQGKEEPFAPTREENHSRSVPKVELVKFINGTECPAGKFVVAKDIRLQWVSAYPAVEIGTELEKAAAWAAANPAKRKKDWRRFLNNWMSRVQERAR